VTEHDIRQRVGELSACRADPGDDPVALVEAALFVEEVFGLRLTDDDMTPERLGTMAAITATVIERMGVR
jgi:acyl carrier protein